MRALPHPTWRWSALLALLVGLGGRGLPAQETSAVPPSTSWPSNGLTAGQVLGAGGLPRAQGATTRFGLRRPSAFFSPGVRRVQATPADTAPPAPGEGATNAGPSSTSAAGDRPSNTDLSLPRAEREGGGGEPTQAAAAEAEKEEEKKEEEPEEEKPAQTPLLAKFLGREEAAVKVYGWIQNSYTGNTNGKPPSGLNFGVNPNNLANSWQGNQYYLIVENPLEQNDQVNFGFRVDNLFGNDATFNHMHGLFDTGYKPNHFLAYDPAQMYGEVHLPVLTRGGLDIKGGRWYTLAGYEVVPATGRPLLSVPYMFNYGQPFTHFGAVSTLHLTERINLYNGTINGWDRWVDRKYKWGYIGGFSWTSKDGNTSMATTLVWGPNQFPNFLPANTRFVPTGATPPPFLAGRRNPGYGSNNRTLFTTVLTHKWNEKLTQVIETDQAFENNVPGFGPGGTNVNASWYSFGNWFLYSFSDKLIGVWRSEIFRDNNGVRTGFATNFSEITLGFQYKPWYWLWIRPEARYDWVRSGHPYNDGTRSSQLTLAVDVIFLF